MACNNALLYEGNNKYRTRLSDFFVLHVFSYLFEKPESDSQ